MPWAAEPQSILLHDIQHELGRTFAPAHFRIFLSPTLSESPFLPPNTS
jgi:hypothetical protein